MKRDKVIPSFILIGLALVMKIAGETFLLNMGQGYYGIAIGLIISGLIIFFINFVQQLK